MNQTFIDVVGVDSALGLHQRTVLLRLAVEQEAVFFSGVFVAVEHGHVAFSAWLHVLGAACEDAVSL